MWKYNLTTRLLSSGDNLAFLLYLQSRLRLYLSNPIPISCLIVPNCAVNVNLQMGEYVLAELYQKRRNVCYCIQRLLKAAVFWNSFWVSLLEVLIRLAGPQSKCPLSSLNIVHGGLLVCNLVFLFVQAVLLHLSMWTWIFEPFPLATLHNIWRACNWCTRSEFRQ